MFTKLKIFGVGQLHLSQHDNAITKFSNDCSMTRQCDSKEVKPFLQLLKKKKKHNPAHLTVAETHTGGCSVSLAPFGAASLKFKF